jgi:LysM repeat protein
LLRLVRLATHAAVILIAIGFVSYSCISRAPAPGEQPVGRASASAGSLAQGGQVGNVQVGRFGTIVKPVDIPTSVPVPRTATSYRVAANDTLESVASKFHVSSEQIRRSNRQLLTATDEVDPGQTLAIPPVVGVYVDQVYSDGSWEVSEMNCVGDGVVDQRLSKRGNVPLTGFTYPAPTSS